MTESPTAPVAVQDRVSVIPFDIEASTLVKASPVTADIATCHLKQRTLQFEHR